MGIIPLLTMLTPTVAPSPTPTLSPDVQAEIVKGVFSNAQIELIQGLFSEQMKSMVTTAPTDRYLIYTFLIIAVVLMISLVVILKITSSSVGKAIAESVKPYVEQLGTFQKSFERSQQSYDKMSEKFGKLTEELVKFQTIRSSEEDRFDLLTRQFQDLQTRVIDNNNSLFTAFREHEKSSYERHIEMQKGYQEVKLQLTEMRVKRRDS